MTGNFEDAETIYREFLSRDGSHLLSSDGTTRLVYLMNNVVYKVMIDRIEDYNMLEYHKMNNTALPEGLFYPECSMYSVDGHNVIAAQYIEGMTVAQCFCIANEECEPSCMSEEVLDKVRDHLGDTGGMNVIIRDNGDIYIIDAAS